jgi:hypothetical protein
MAAGIVLAPVTFAFADEDVSVGLSASGPAQAQVQAGVQLRGELKDLKGEIRDVRQDIRQERRDVREDRREDRHDGTASSTASSTREMKRPIVHFWAWLFGHSDSTTLGTIRAEIAASSTASTTPAEVHFFARLRALLHL